MTFTEVTKQIHNLSNGNINGEHFTLSEYRFFVKKLVKPENKIPNALIGTVKLPDGEWPYEIYKVPGFENMWDYYIPDDREHAEELWAKV